MQNKIVSSVQIKAPENEKTNKLNPNKLRCGRMKIFVFFYIKKICFNAMMSQFPRNGAMSNAAAAADEETERKRSKN